MRVSASGRARAEVAPGRDARLWQVEHWCPRWHAWTSPRDFQYEVGPHHGTRTPNDPTRTTTTTLVALRRADRTGVAFAWRRGGKRFSSSDGGGKDRDRKTGRTLSRTDPRETQPAPMGTPASRPRADRTCVGAEGAGPRRGADGHCGAGGRLRRPAEQGGDAAPPPQRTQPKSGRSISAAPRSAGEALPNPVASR